MLAYCVSKLKNHLHDLSNEKLVATAVYYMHHFYLTGSVLDTDPENIMYASLYLASKVEEVNLTHDSFCRDLKKDPVKLNLIHNEQILLIGLNF